jgi:hypothetical protein
MEVMGMLQRTFLVVCAFALCVIAQSYLSGQQPQTSDNSGASQSTPKAHVKSAGGTKTAVGCVAKEGEGFVLKTEEGTYQFDTSRDLSNLVGKKVKIVGQWQATGVTTAAPIEQTKAAGAEAGGQEDTAQKSSNAHRAFTGDMRLHITGDVIGDCSQGK